MGFGAGEEMKRFLHDFVAGATTLFPFSKKKKKNKPYCFPCAGEVCEVVEEEDKRNPDLMRRRMKMMVAERKKKIGVGELSLLVRGRKEHWGGD